MVIVALAHACTFARFSYVAWGEGIQPSEAS